MRLPDTGELFLFKTFSMSTVNTTTLDEQLLQNVQLLGSQIGHTPLHRITRLFNKPGVAIYAKKEWEQLSGSVKARAAYAIFKAAIENGELTTQKALLDATSGKGYFMGEFIGLEITIKDSVRYKDEPGKWGYYSFGHEYPLKNEVSMNKAASCNACHEKNVTHPQNTGKDWTFEQYYPVLRGARAALKK